MPRISLKYLHPVADHFKDICVSIEAAIPEEMRKKWSMKKIPLILKKFMIHMQEDVVNGYSVGFHHDKLLVITVRVEEMGIVKGKETRQQGAVTIRERIFCSKAMGYSFKIDVIGRLKKIYKFKFTPDRKMVRMLWDKLDNTDIAYELIEKKCKK